MPFRVLGDIQASRRVSAALAFSIPDYQANAAYEEGDFVTDAATGELYRVTVAIPASADIATDIASLAKVDQSGSFADNGDGTFTYTDSDGVTTTIVDTRASAAPFDGAGSGTGIAGVTAATTVEEAIQALDAAVDAANDGTGVAVDTTNFDGANNAVLGATEGDVQTALDAIDEALRDFTGTDGVTDGAQGLVPTPAVADDGKFLSSDGTWASVTATGADAAAADTTNFDGALSAAEDTVQKALDALDDIVTPIADFATKPDAGLVPAKAAAGDDDKFLKGDGTWADVPAALPTKTITFTAAQFATGGFGISSLDIPFSVHGLDEVNGYVFLDRTGGDYPGASATFNAGTKLFVLNGGGTTFDGVITLFGVDAATAVALP